MRKLTLKRSNISYAMPLIEDILQNLNCPLTLKVEQSDWTFPELNFSFSSLEDFTKDIKIALSLGNPSCYIIEVVDTTIPNRFLIEVVKTSDKPRVDSYTLREDEYTEIDKAEVAYRKEGGVNRDVYFYPKFDDSPFNRYNNIINVEYLTEGLDLKEHGSSFAFDMLGWCKEVIKKNSK